MKTQLVKKSKFIILVTFFGLLSCSNDDDNSNHEDQNLCDFITQISTDQYENGPADQLTINSMEIENSCLIINFTSVGCDGSTWDFKLVDSAEIIQSNPLQRNIRLSLNNDEECLSIVTKEVSFDISVLKVSGNKVMLNVTNGDDSILYEY